MNERIKELLKKAQKITAENYAPGGRDYEREIYSKFAELIVRECMKVIIDDMDSNPDDEAFNDALDHAQSIIGEHFGVEL